VLRIVADRFVMFCAELEKLLRELAQRRSRPAARCRRRARGLTHYLDARRRHQCHLRLSEYQER
jgi:hypothetical protein